MRDVEGVVVVSDVTENQETDWNVSFTIPGDFIKLGIFGCLASFALFLMGAAVAICMKAVLSTVEVLNLVLPCA